MLLFRGAEKSGSKIASVAFAHLRAEEQSRNKWLLRDDVSRSQEESAQAEDGPIWVRF
jgi:hypothetical protein